MECTKCQGRGLIIRDGTAYPCPCVRESIVAAKIRVSGLPEIMLECKFKAFNLKFYSRSVIDQVTKNNYYDSARLALKDAGDFVKSFVKNARATESLLFSGPVGSGKTFLACCIANELLEEGVSVNFVVVPDLLDRIRSTYDQNKPQWYESEQGMLDAARETPLLILDDLGAHNYTEWTRNKLYSIINYRLNYFLPTVITTNLSLQRLNEYLGERTVSRIIHMCRMHRLMVDQDIRVKKKKLQGSTAGEWQ
jgi:DNA replication protein DnaC